MTGPTWEAKAPRDLFERLASQLSAHGYDYTGSPGRAYGAETPCDVALALSIAANGNEIGWAAFWARWMQRLDARIDLAALIVPKKTERSRYATDLRLAYIAAYQYCEDRLPDRHISKEIRVARAQLKNIPQHRKRYDLMLDRVHRAESRLWGSLRDYSSDRNLSTSP